MKILKPSVVQISTQRAGAGSTSQPRPTDVGTGIILDEQGNVLTNFHVVEATERIIVTLDDGRAFDAVPVGGDLRTDTAVIKIEADGLLPAQLGNASELEVGEDVIAIGHALGLRGGPTVSKGVLSALDRTIETDPINSIFITDLIQTDASINPGNSGGPLVNTDAEVIGVNTAIIREGEGIGFALNIDNVKAVVAQLIDQGFVDRGFLGITPENVTPALATQFSLPVTEGIVVARVIVNSAADEARLEVGDIIVRLGQQEIANTGELSNFLLANPPGETVTIEYIRGEETRLTSAQLRDRPR